MKLSGLLIDRVRFAFPIPVIKTWICSQSYHLTLRPVTSYGISTSTDCIKCMPRCKKKKKISKMKCK